MGAASVSGWAGRRMPRNFPVYRPLTVQIEDLRLEGPAGPIILSVFVKFFSVGAISVKVRTPVDFRPLWTWSFSGTCGSMTTPRWTIA